jgi:ribonuclease P/MRP protein subunit POP3
MVCIILTWHTSTHSRLDRPAIPPDVQNSFQAAIIDLLSCLKDYHIQQNRNAKKGALARKKAANRKEKEEQPHLQGKKRKMTDDVLDTASSKRRKTETGESIEVSNPSDVSESGDKNVGPSEGPDILKNVKCGLNQTEKALEQHISNLRDCLTKGVALTDDVITPRIVLACRWDVNPPDRFAHIPHLVASANRLGDIYEKKFASAPAIPEIKLVNLPHGSEKSLSDAVGIRRLSMVILNVGRGTSRDRFAESTSL